MSKRAEYVEVTKVDLMDGEELMDLAKKVMVAITQHKGKLQKSLGLMGIFKDHIVVRDFEDGKMFRMEMKRDEGGNVLLEGLEEVKQVFVPVKPRTQKSDGLIEALELPAMMVLTEGGQLCTESIDAIKETVEELHKAVWSGAFINDLPDSSFLYIEPGGKKDADGKTTPRSLRHFPVKDAGGKPDPAHVRNALSRIPQANLPQDVKDKCKAAAEKLLAGLKKADEPAEPAYLRAPEESLWRGVLG